MSTHGSWGSSTTSCPSTWSSVAVLHHQPQQQSQHQAWLRHRGKQDAAAYGGQWIWQQPSQRWPKWQKKNRLRASGWNIRDRTNKGHLVVGVYYRSPDQGALVSPQLRYCLYVWCPQHRKDMELLKRVQMRTTKNGQRAGTPLLLWR